jgi:hypothetical protein
MKRFARTAALVTTVSVCGIHSAAAQTVKVEVRVPEISREIRSVIREVTMDLGDVAREISRELSRELPEISQSVGRVARDVTRSVTRDIGRGLGELRRADGAWGWEQNNWKAQAVDRETKRLALGANGSLELHNLSGDVSVVTSSGRDVTVEIVRTSHGRTDADAKLGLERVRATVETNGNRGTVRSDYGNERRPPYSVSIDMIVAAPAGTRVTVTSMSGDVVVRGMQGELSVTTMSGDVRLSNVGSVSEAKTASGDVVITGSDGDGTLDAGTLSGDVTLQQVKARRVSASSVSGTVSARDVLADNVTLNVMSGDVVFSGGLAKNGRYEMTTHNGDLQFTPAGSVGFSVTATSVMGEISSAMSLTSDRPSSTRSRRKSLTGKSGDGSASVTLTTFNGDIVIKK